MKKFTIFALLLMGFSLAAVAQSVDTYAYPARTAGNLTYNLTNKWIYSNVLDNFNANKPNSTTGTVRGMVAKNGIMYFPDRENRQLVRVDALTGTKLTPIPFADNIFTYTHKDINGNDSIGATPALLLFNDLRKDAAGNLLVGASVLNANVFQIWKVDENTGEGSLVLEEKLWDNPKVGEMNYRLDHFGVYGDVDNHAIIMAADANSMKVFKWTINNGAVDGLAQLISLYVDPSDNSYLMQDGVMITNPGSAPHVLPLDDNYFYLDGFATYPTLFNMDGTLADDFKMCEVGIQVANNEGDTCQLLAGHNGICEFYMGSERFLLMAATNTVGTPNSAFALYKFANGARTFADMEPLWYFPNAGLGSTSNGYRAAPVAVEVNEETKEATVYIYTCENGYGVYTLSCSEDSTPVLPPSQEQDSILARISYELNGGVTNAWGWETPQDMYETLNADYNTFYGYEDVWSPLDSFTDYVQGIPTVASSMDTPFLSDANFVAHFQWLADYMKALCLEAQKTNSNIYDPTVNGSSYLRHNLGAFFKDAVRTSWPTTADYTHAGISTYDAYASTWKGAYSNPSAPTETFTLNAPYKERSKFEGWYTTADFSGERVLTVDANTTGTLYAKWGDFGPGAYDYPREYTLLQNALDSLETALATTLSTTNPKTVQAANAFVEQTKLALDAVAYSNQEALLQKEVAEEFIARLQYAYLNIHVAVPGSMGDSILTYVENFTDVQSLKLSGTLNDADYENIKTRLTNLSEIDLAEVNMSALPNEFFRNHTNLVHVDLPNNLQKIGEYAFYNCSNLSSIEFPVELDTIGYEAFYQCTSLRNIVLPEGLTSLGSYAFYGCNLVYVRIPSTLTVIESSAFAYNKQLQKVDFVEGLQTIKSSAFEHCTGLTSLQFPTTLHTIENSAFYYDQSLQQIMLNEGLHKLGDGAFSECDALTEVILPSTLVLANSSPFNYCDNLKKVTCLSVVPPYVTQSPIYGCDMTGRELYVPSLSVNTYKQTTGWDQFTAIKTIEYLPKNITVLGNVSLTLPSVIDPADKPNVKLICEKKSDYYYNNEYEYGVLSVNGPGTLSINKFSMVWNNYRQYEDYYNEGSHYCALLNNSHLRADSVEITLDARNDVWSFIALPFDVQVSDIVPTSEGVTNWVVRKYNGEQRAAGALDNTWTKVGANDVLNAGVGYIIQGSRYFENSHQYNSTFKLSAINNTNKNNIFTTEDVTLILNEYQSEFAHNRGWNLIGNPYPCYYDTRFVNVTVPITVWSMRDNTYTAYSPVDDSYILRPGEAFFMQCPLDANSITFSKDGRQIDKAARTVARMSAKMLRANQPERLLLNLTISDDQYSDRTRIVLNEEATVDYETDKDANKFMSTDRTVPQLYSTYNTVNYAINERPFVNGVVELSVRTPKKKEYTIALQESIAGYHVILEDNMLNTSVELDANSVYTFMATSIENAQRFVLRIVRANDATTAIENVNSDIKSSGKIYTIMGVEVQEPLENGIYIKDGKKFIINK